MHKPLISYSKDLDISTWNNKLSVNFRAPLAKNLDVNFRAPLAKKLDVNFRAPLAKKLDVNFRAPLAQEPEVTIDSTSYLSNIHCQRRLKRSRHNLTFLCVCCPFFSFRLLMVYSRP